MSNLGRLRGKARRSSARNLRTSLYEYNKDGTRILKPKKPTKSQLEALELGFTGYSLKYGNIMILGTIEEMLPEYKHDIDPDINNLCRNDIFEGIKADRIGLFYSPKQKKFMYIILNDDYSIGILFKADNLKDLPYSDRFDIENLHPSLQMLENINRTLISVYYHSPVVDLTGNPIHNYGILEVFKK